MRYQHPFNNQRGSLRHGIGLLLVILVIIIIFYFIGEFETKSEDYGYQKSEETSSDQGDSFFEGDKTNSGKSQLLEDDLKVDEKDVTQPENPNDIGKNSKDAFYDPPSPEKRREMESKSNQSSVERP